MKTVAIASQKGGTGEAATLAGYDAVVIDLMAAPTLSRKGAAFGSNVAPLLILVIFCLLIINSIFIDRGYFDALPQDLFGYLDGIYRTHLGQIPHRDFSTPQGPLFFYCHLTSGM